MRKDPPNKMMTDELEIKIIDLYKGGMSASKILDEIKLFKTPKTIYDILYKHGVLARSGDTRRDPNLNHSYFSKIDSENKAYVLGLLVSDGWVTGPQKNPSGHVTKSPQIAFSLTEEDVDLVEWVKTQWGSQNKISTITKLPAEYPNGQIYESKPMKRIMISSTKMFMDLNKLGVDPNKSYVSILPPIDKKYYSHFLRGLFDGDGTTGVYPYGNNGDMHLKIKFIGTQCIMGQIAWMLHDKCGITYVKPSGFKNRVLSSIEWNKLSDTQKLADYIYKDIDKSYSLLRKREIIENFFN